MWVAFKWGRRIEFHISARGGRAEGSPFLKCQDFALYFLSSAGLKNSVRINTFLYENETDRTKNAYFVFQSVQIEGNYTNAILHPLNHVVI